MMKQYSLLFVFSLFIHINLFSQHITPQNDTIKGVSEFEAEFPNADEAFSNDSIPLIDSLAVFDMLNRGPILDMLDSLLFSSFFSGNGFVADTALLNKYGFQPNEIPTYSDSLYFERISKLNAATPIELTYNAQVKDFIGLYANKRRALTSRI